MANKIKNCVSILFGSLFTFFPYIIAVIYGIVYLTGGWQNICEGHDYKFYFLPEIRIFCLMLFSESQSRYKCLILPYIFVVSAGFLQIIEPWNSASSEQRIFKKVLTRLRDSYQ